ncbi:MAG: thioredoxin-disulfide reductase [Microbacteriaceae bacterium]|nr:thioredoxin-disulfide reductase [Microbacteriaceae bacterium]
MPKLVIIGSGPAALTAAIYAARAELQPVLIASSVQIGGELMNTTDVENFPGFPEGIMGPDLMERIQAQAEKFGTEVVYDDVTDLQLSADKKIVQISSGKQYEADAVIYATGSEYRKLGVPGEDKLAGYGVSWCATCDGAFFKEREIAVIGGGDSAMEEALFLTRFASKVYVIHRRDSLKASKIMQRRAFEHEKIEFVWNTELVSIDGENSVVGVTMRNVETNEESQLPVQGVFVAIGNDPRTHLIHGQLELTGVGTIQTDGRSSKTNIPGVFAAGDVIDATYRQAITAAGSGAAAAIDAEHYLAALEDSKE